MDKINIFMSFAPEDKKDGMMLADQCRNPFSTFAVVGVSTEMEGNEDWERKTRELIEQAGIMLIVASKNTDPSANVVCEIGMARKKGIPVLGVYTDKAYQDCIPEIFGDGPVLEWNFEHVCNAMLNLLGRTATRKIFM
ncbi:MAG: TIR domain-containing protein [Syntrophales bacterium]|jgi:nucleoside 2-deoxyribosyltransferase|nr:TIR domain-containing protein [Syntrophales bacterium]NLN60681.1 hypothetical protein [Deltaproteobacteria bacterium]